MKYLILGVIRMYWLIPKSRRRKCIFRESCSNHVYSITKNKGFNKGINAFLFRYKNCRSHIETFENPISKEIQIILPGGKIVSQHEIAKRIL